MGKKLTAMTWSDMQQEMSIAGDPEKIAELGQEIMELIVYKTDRTNRAELINIEFMLQRIIAETRLWQRMYDKSH
jgi:hypothetical protein